ncbi:MAG TPA: Ig-like domain-containing protein [Actinomycetota bacterium]|nr:Ig-like domain-containing protein [Actinomycetota bacterium]
MISPTRSRPAPTSGLRRATRLLWVVGAFLAASGAVNAQAFWASTDSGNSARAGADALQQAPTPEVALTGPSSVSIDFPRALTTSGREVTSYLVARYSSSVATTPSATFTCGWPSSSALVCSEADVPDGTWHYGVSARIAGSLWTGTEGGRSASVTVDTAAPAAPSTPDLAPASDTGASSIDNVTGTAAPTFTGTAEPDSTVKLYAGLVQVGNGVAAGGSYNIQVTKLADGQHTITATATDAAGNLSAASTGLTVTIDTAAPPAPSTPDLADASDTGISSVDNLTSDATPAFAGIAEDGSTVTIRRNGDPVGSGPASAGSYDVTVLTLGDGEHSITATAADVAGNVSSASGGLTVRVDTAAPAAPSVPDLAAESDTGSSATDNVTSALTPDFTGTAESGATVTVRVDGSPAGSTAAAGGSYGVTVSSLDQGAHTVTSVAADAAGNVSPASGGLVVTIDSVAPAAPAPAPDLAAGSDTGISDADQITNDTTPTFTSTGPANVEAGATVTLLSGGSPVGTASATGTGAYSVTASTLAETGHTITITATDLAGNTSEQSASLVVTVDTTAPLVTASVLAKPGGYLSGYVRQGGGYYIYANVTEALAGGVLSETADVSAVTPAGTAIALTSGSYSAGGVTYNYRSSTTQNAATPLGTGLKSYSIVSTDKAGNARTQPDWSVTVDNTAPAAAEINTTNKAGGTAGAAEAGDSITLRFTERIDPYSILSGWTGGPTGVVVHVVDGGGCVLFLLCQDDYVEIYDGANSSRLPFGTLDLNAVDYNGSSLLGLGTQADMVFGASGTASTMEQSGATITITLGTKNSGGNWTGSSTNFVWSPSTSPYDAAGNPLSSAAAGETGGGDSEF